MLYNTKTGSPICIKWELRKNNDDDERSRWLSVFTFSIVFFEKFETRVPYIQTIIIVHHSSVTIIIITNTVSASVIFSWYIWCISIIGSDELSDYSIIIVIPFFYFLSIVISCRIKFFRDIEVQLLTSFLIFNLSFQFHHFKLLCSETCSRVQSFGELLMTVKTL